MNRAFVFLLVFSLAPLFSACDDSSPSGDAGVAGDGDADAGDGDADADVDVDVDADGDTDGGDADDDPEPLSRWIELEGSMNTRDIGGYPVAGGTSIRWRKLIRSGHVSSLTEAGCATFASEGIKTVIDLRMDPERGASPPSPCVTETAEVVPVAMEKILPPSAENYLALMERSGDAVAPLFAALAKVESYPVLYHCIIGRDRVNFANALIMSALGADRETILEEYRLGEGVDDEWIEAVLDEIDRLGGIETYLTGAGVPPEHLEALRANALE